MYFFLVIIIVLASDLKSTILIPSAFNIVMGYYTYYLQCVHHINIDLYVIIVYENFYRYFFYPMK